MLYTIAQVAGLLLSRVTWALLKLLVNITLTQWPSYVWPVKGPSRQLSWVVHRLASACKLLFRVQCRLMTELNWAEVMSSAALDCSLSFTRCPLECASESEASEQLKCFSPLAHFPCLPFSLFKAKVTTNH